MLPNGPEKLWWVCEVLGVFCGEVFGVVNGNVDDFFLFGLRVTGSLGDDSL